MVTILTLLSSSYPLNMPKFANMIQISSNNPELKFGTIFAKSSR